MARFYGTVQGGRGEASRLGHTNTGLHVSAQSYSGDVRVRLYAAGDEDWVEIVCGGHQHWQRLTIFNGPVENLGVLAEMRAHQDEICAMMKLLLSGGENV